MIVEILKIGLTLSLLLVSNMAVVAQDAKIVARKVLPSLVFIEVFDSSKNPIGRGSGFFVRQDVIATNYHVIEGAFFARVTDSEGNVLAVTGSVGIDEDHDLALLKLNASGGQPLKIADISDLEVGEDIYAFGNPRGLQGSVSVGIISSKGTRHIGKGNLFQITAPISPGSSGGPVVNKQGDVIGVASGSLSDSQNLNFAVPSAYLSLLLANMTSVVSLAHSPNSKSGATAPSKDPSTRQTTPPNTGPAANEGPGSRYFPIRVSVRADNTSNGWNDSSFMVYAGQRLRISATGLVSLGGGNTSTPVGLPRLVDRDKLMRSEPTGALIAVIGIDNDDFIFVGADREFVAQRSGRLFLGVNESSLGDNSGMFDAIIEAEAPRSALSSANTIANEGSASGYFSIRLRVRADNVSNGWNDSGLMVRVGQRVRITATGRVSLGGGNMSTPVGLPRLVDRNKLMRNEATGALIAVIGDDNDTFIFVGASREFVAQRSGRLFLAVNEGNLSDNSGMFDVTIEAEVSR